MQNLLPSYERELAFLRQHAGDFAQNYPKIAGQLLMTGDVGEDPHVERMTSSTSINATTGTRPRPPACRHDARGPLMKLPKNTAALASLIVLAAAASLIALLYPKADELHRLIAVSWGDGKYGKAFYGAYVYYEEQSDGQLQVMLRIEIDRPSLWTGYAHGARPLGIAKSTADAVDKWGVVTWSDAGLTVGRAKYAYLLPRAELERHR